MKTIAINVEKGGSGKTTIACHLAWHLADKGARVLVIDMDRQGNSTSTLGEFTRLGDSLPLFQEKMGKVSYDRLSIYSNEGLGEFDGNFSEALTNFRTNFPKLNDHFDYCVIDTPPLWGWINFAALMVCDYLFVPVQLGRFNVDGVKNLSDSIQSVNKAARTKPIILAGIVPNMVEISELRKAVGPYLFDNYLPKRRHFAHAMEAAVPTWRLGKDVRTSMPFMTKFLNEAMRRIDEGNAA
jgi:chromosome partitioning protein